MLDLKRELFFIKRLLQEGYGPLYWWSYVKNRFFWRYMLAGVPQLNYIPDPDLELHTIANKNDLWMLTWMLRSFIIISKLRPLVVIHDDGSLDRETTNFIIDKFPNTQIMFRSETTKKILEMPDVPEIIKKARIESHFFIDKLINPILFSKAKKLIISDTDILWYKFPSEIVDFVAGNTPEEGLVQRQGKGEAEFDLMMDEEYTTKYKLKESTVSFMNGGYVVIDRDKISIEQLAEYFSHTKRPLTDYFIEMAGWACMLGQVNFKFLPSNRYAIKGFLNDDMVMKHYTSPRRYEMFAYGIDKAKDAVKR